MPDIKRTVKLVTEQKIVDSSSEPPLRHWSIRIYLEGPGKEEVAAGIFSNAQYRLHETFEDRMIQDKSSPPFLIKEKGWGEFDMQIILRTIEKGQEFTISHDLNFQSEKYEAKHPIIFKGAKGAVVEELRKSGPIPGEVNGVKGVDSAKKKKRPDKGIDMDKLAENLQKLSEDNLLTVVQMIHDNKTDETYMKNDVEQGEFHVDLYTLPDTLIRDLWAFCTSKQASA